MVQFHQSRLINHLVLLQLFSHFYSLFPNIDSLCRYLYHLSLTFLWINKLNLLFIIIFIFLILIIRLFCPLWLYFLHTLFINVMFLDLLVAEFYPIYLIQQNHWKRLIRYEFFLILHFIFLFDCFQFLSNQLLVKNYLFFKYKMQLIFLSLRKYMPLSGTKIYILIKYILKS